MIRNPVVKIVLVALLALAAISFFLVLHGWRSDVFVVGVVLIAVVATYQFMTAREMIRLRRRLTKMMEVLKKGDIAHANRDYRLVSHLTKLDTSLNTLSGSADKREQGASALWVAGGGSNSALEGLVTSHEDDYDLRAERALRELFGKLLNGQDEIIEKLANMDLKVEKSRND